MDDSMLTQLLTILLGVSIVILFILIVAFIVIALKKRTKEKSTIKSEIKNEESKDVNAARNMQPKVYTIENIKKFMDFDEIKDNMIVQKDGKRLIMVIQCQGVNYDLMSSVEKTGIEMGFVQFLNTLTRPIQLYIQARKVNLEDSVNNYKKRLKTIENEFNKAKMQYEDAQLNTKLKPEKFKNIRMEYIRQKNLYEYTKDIIDNTQKMSLNKNILTKNYYITLAYYPDNSEDLFKKEELLDMAFSELYTNAQAMIRTLSVCGVVGKVLNSVELADLLYVAYNRDASEIYGVDKAIRSGYDSLYTTAPDVISRKIEALDKVIDERALELANDTIDKVTLKSRRQKELENKEHNLDELIRKTAKRMIEENKDYIPENIAEESIKEIENTKQKDEKEIKSKKIKKGA